MDWNYDKAKIAAILSTTQGQRTFASYTDRDVWGTLRTRPAAIEIVARAEQALMSATPQVLATDYLAYVRAGQREPYEDPINARRDRLMIMTLAECLEGQGRFTDAVLNEVWAICEESTWVVPAHGSSYPDHLPDLSVPYIDLWSAITSFALAEVDHLLTDTLHPAVRRRIRYEISKRSTDAFLIHNDYAWLGYGKKQINNWMPVCVGGTAGAALYLETDVDRLAAVLAKAIDGLQRYFATFGDDGVCVEGVGYWEKGLFFYAAFGQLLFDRTEGQIDLFDNDHIRQVVAFPTEVELSPGHFVAFSDTGINRHPQFALLHFFAQRFDVPTLAALDHAGSKQHKLTYRGPSEKVRDLFWYPAEFQPVTVVPKASMYLPDTQWMIARAKPDNPDGLVLAAKGGFNNEPHNHNDVGSVMVHWCGESLLAELGAMRYTRDSFRPEYRYTFLANRSGGHSVPIVNGYEQGTGDIFAARKVQHTAKPELDMLELDLTDAYPKESGLARLHRQIMLHRKPLHGYVELIDTVNFGTEAGQFETVLISFAPAIEQEPGCICLTGARGKLFIYYDSDQLQQRIECVPDVDLRHGPHNVTRIVLATHHKIHKAHIVIRIEPNL